MAKREREQRRGRAGGERYGARCVCGGGGGGGAEKMTDDIIGQ